jgi:hypothetical protein
MFGTNITLLPYKHKYIEIPHDENFETYINFGF